MSFIVEPVQSGTMTGAGDILVPIAGEHDLWDAIWAAPPYWGASNSTTPNVGAAATFGGMKFFSTHSMRIQKPLSITLGNGGRSGVTTIPASITDFTSVWVLDVRTGTQGALTIPGAVVDTHLGELRLWHGAPLTAAIAPTGKHVWAFVRRGGVWEIWGDGALRASATAGATTDTTIGLNRNGQPTDMDFFETRFVSRALTPAQIVAASQDLALIHGA